MSSFLSSLFGYSDRPAQGSKLAYIPDELKPYVLEILKDTQELYKQRMKEGYTPYTGDTIAGLTPEEIASQEGLKSLVGTQRPFQEESLGLLRGGSEQFTADTAKKYMSPYMRAVIDSEKEQSQRQYESTKAPQFEKAAVDAGGMSGLGSRAGVQAAEMASGQQRLLADIESRGQQKAYQDAQQAFEDQKRRERELAGDISTAGQNIFSSGLAEQGLLKGIGEEKRQLAQSGLDEAYMKYMEQKQFPEQQLARYMSSIYGNPVLKQPNYRTSETPAQASKAKSLIGLGLGGLKSFGSGSYSKGLKNLFGASGGQVGGLNTLHRQTGGTLEIMDEDVEFQTGADRQPEEIVAAREAAREAVAATAIPKPNAPDILAEADRFEKLSPSERALETATRKFKDNPYYAKELLSKKERDKRSEDQAKIMNEMLDKREKLSTDRQVDAFLVGWLKPFGTPASGVEEISKEQLKRYKVVDKVKDTQAVKQAAELMQNLKDSYPENVYLKIMEKYQNLIKSGLTREKLIASIKKLNREASGLISREKSATLASKKMPDNFAESELDASDSIVDQTFTNPAMRKLVKAKIKDPTFGGLFGGKDITDSEIKSRMWAKITTGAATSPRQALSEVLKEIFAPKK